MRTPVVILAWVASLVLAWLVGANFGGASEGVGRTPAERVVVGSDGGGGPAAKRSAPAGKEPAPSREKPRSAPRQAAQARDAEPEEPYTLDGVATLEEASRRFMKFASVKLAEGPEGHLALLRELDRIMQDESYRPLLRDEAAAMRLAYPWLKFAFEKETHILAMTETVYKTAAENPAWFEGLDDDVIEIFAEGLAVLLPGAVSEEQLARFRGYVEKILANNPETLPKALQKNFRDFQRNLRYWAPSVSQEDALQQLLDPSVSNARKLALLQRANPKELKGVDLGAILAPALEQGSSDALRVLGRLRLAGRDVVTLDQAFVTGAANGKLHGWYVRQYLDATGRRTWDAARPFVEEGLRRGGKATAMFAQGLPWLQERPPKEFVQGVVDGYDLDEKMKTYLKQQFKLE